MEEVLYPEKVIQEVVQGVAIDEVSSIEFCTKDESVNCFSYKNC